MTALKPLPDLDGPKLEPFTLDITAHDVEFLWVPRLDEEAMHSIIAQARIDGRVYCLKLVCSGPPNTYGHVFLALADFFGSSSASPKPASSRMSRMMMWI